VNQFFENPTLRYVSQLKKAAADEGVRLVRIMVDNEGDMAAIDASERRRSAIAHRKWVDIAHELGCVDIRCNARGPADAGFVERAAGSFRDLLDYAKPSGLNIVIENHGGASSDAPTLVKLMKAVNDPRFGTLPDFGNLNPGDDPYDVIRQLMPFAKGVSVKAMWQADGSHPRYSVEKMIELARAAGFHGDWGIESSFDGRATALTPEQMWANESKGVMLTKATIERTLRLI
jgi:L-ribulose-5-phosphate 3-epimerase